MPGWLRSRWTLGGLAVAAFGLVVWFVGDTLVLGETRPLEESWQRLLLAGTVAAAWIGWEILRSRRARRENERLLEVIAGGGDAAGAAARAAHEVALLRQRFESAAAVLKSARFVGPDGERRYLHELPWYVIIGAPGSGKTTALVNSGLRFPLRKAGAEPGIAGIGGTRNCDWWFTDGAVLLDTAGRYTTQESDRAADASAWLGFLDLLKRFRPRRPLNGALVTLSISDLVLWNDDERARYAAHVRERLAEIYARLGVRFPVYLLVTKSDLIAGFMEFFGELDTGARAQVWGTTFGYAAAQAGEAPGGRFAVEFAALEGRLYAELMERLQREGDLQRRAAIYRFPQEFHGTGPLVERFIEAAFAGQPSAPFLRGVYFTSGTQEGSPIDRVLGTLARSFKLESAAAAAGGGAGKSFFLSNLVRRVIFPESGLAGSDEGLERRLKRMRMLAYAAIAAVTAGLAAAWTASYLSNRNFVEEAQEKVAAAKAVLGGAGAIAAGQELKLVGALDTLRELPGGYGDRGRGAAVPGGLGLSQRDKLGPLALRAYQNALRDALLPRFAMALEGELRERVRNPKGREGLREALDAYVGLYESRRPDQATFEAAARHLWRLPDAALAGHLRAGLELGAAEVRHPRDEAIIRAARQLLGIGKTS
jgi:type VI secretion system protein ImpL